MRHATTMLLTLLLGCAGSHKATLDKTKAKPLTAEQTKAFDHGVDLVATLQGLEGKWRDDWDHDLQTRIGSSELIATIKVNSTLADTDPSQNVTYHLVAHIERELWGSDSDKEIDLISRPSDTGYTTVKENLARITEGPHLAYVLKGPDGLAWHLSPASAEVLEQTESQITVLRRAPEQAQQQTVIVR